MVFSKRDDATVEVLKDRYKGYLYENFGLLGAGCILRRLRQFLLSGSVRFSERFSTAKEDIGSTVLFNRENYYFTPLTANSLAEGLHISTKQFVQLLRSEVALELSDRPQKVVAVKGNEQIMAYRLYDDTALERLQQIMLFRELEFPLKEIKAIMSDPHFDRQKALDQQIELLKLRREHFDDLITFATGIKLLGVNYAMSRSKNDFSAFDKTKLDEYTKRAKEQWGSTAEYKEFEEKSGKRTDTDNERLMNETMELFVQFGKMRDRDPADSEVQAQVKRLQEFFCENFYNCTNEILRGLGKMYAGGGEFTENIDKASGAGTAEFVNRAIEIYCD